MANQETVSPQEDPTPEDEGRIGTLNSVLAGPEITVGEPEETVPRPRQRGRRMVQIRVNESIEEMSYVGGGRREVFTFETGHVYNVPVEIAIELERLGKVWH